MAQKGVLTTSDYIPIDEFNNFLDLLRAEKDYVWEMFCYLSFSCQLRYSDASVRQWIDILNKDQAFIQETKTGKIRRIELNENVRNRFNELYLLMGKPNLSEYIFKSPKTGRPYTSQHINQILKGFRSKYKLSLRNFSTHTFRKTFGRMVYEKSLRSGESLILLNEVFQHSSISTTKAYIGLRKEEIAKVYDFINF